MNKYISKKGLLILALVAMMMLVVGCAGDSKEKDQKKGNETADKAEGNQSDDPTDVKLVLLNTATFPEGEDENDNRYLNKIEEAANLNITVETPPSANYDERLNIIMVGDDLPDMIHSRNANWYADFAVQGAFTPLKSILEEHGKNLLELIPEHAWEAVTIDGDYYAIPLIGESMGYEVSYARKDMLDELDLEAPKTLDEYVDVLRAFKEEYNGLGIMPTDNLSLLSPLFGAFGVQRDQWKEVDGELVYAMTLPEAKEAVSFLADLYEEGLLDNEFTSNITDVLNEKVANDKTGLYFGGWTATRSALLTNEQNNEKAEWITIDYPVGPYGDSGPAASQFVIGFNTIPVTSDNAVEIVKMLDYIVSDGFKEIYLGIEGEVWETVDGEFVTDFEEHNEQIYRQMLRVVSPYDLELIELRLDSLGEEFRLFENLTKINDNVQLDAYTGPPAKAQTLHGGQLSVLEEEYLARIIAGVDPIDKYDEFIERWFKEGGQDWTDEVNEWKKDN